MPSPERLVEPPSRGPRARPQAPGDASLRRSAATDPLLAGRAALDAVIGREADAGSRQRLVDRLQPQVGNAAVARLLASPTDGRVAPASGRRASAPPASIQRDEDDDLDAFWPPGSDGAEELEEAAPTPTTSGTTINVVNTTYSVGGTLIEAANAIAARPEAGSVTSQFSDIYFEQSTAGRVTLANITVTETVNLPTWTGYASASTAEKAEWDRFHAALAAHEARHVAIDREHFTNIHRQLVGKSEARANEIITEKETAATTANNEFDTQTDHGRNAGTTINPPTSSPAPTPAAPAQAPASP